MRNSLQPASPESGAMAEATTRAVLTVYLLVVRGINLFLAPPKSDVF